MRSSPRTRQHVWRNVVGQIPRPDAVSFFTTNVCQRFVQSKRLKSLSTKLPPTLLASNRPHGQLLRYAANPQRNEATRRTPGTFILRGHRNRRCVLGSQSHPPRHPLPSNRLANPRQSRIKVARAIDTATG